MERGPFSRFPDALDPVLSLLPYHGDLGLDDREAAVGLRAGQGQARRVREGRRRRRLPARHRARADQAAARTAPGRSPSTASSRWVKLQVSDSPGKRIALGGVLLAILGLLGSLFIRPRRTWVRVASGGRAYRGRAGRTGPQRRRRPGGRGRRARERLRSVTRQSPRPRRQSVTTGTNPEGAAVSTADFAAFSNNAIAFASVVYVLAFAGPPGRVGVRALRAGDGRVPAARRRRREPVAVGSARRSPAPGGAA